MLGILKRLFATGVDTKLKETIESGAVLIDVRTPGEFASGHIKGSVNIPLDRIGSQLLILKKNNPIVVFCRSGNRSKAAKGILELKGFSNVTDGGSINTVNKLITTK